MERQAPGFGLWALGQSRLQHYPPDLKVRPTDDPRNKGLAFLPGGGMTPALVRVVPINLTYVDVGNITKMIQEALRRPFAQKPAKTPSGAKPAPGTGKREQPHGRRGISEGCHGTTGSRLWAVGCRL